MDNDNIGYKPKIFNSATHIHTGKKKEVRKSTGNGKNWKALSDVTQARKDKHHLFS